jgi:hypothetical protein
MEGKMVTVVNLSLLGSIRGWIQSRDLMGAAWRAAAGGKNELSDQLLALKTTPHGPFVLVADGMAWHVIAT